MRAIRRDPPAPMTYSDGHVIVTVIAAAGESLDLLDAAAIDLAPYGRGSVRRVRLVESPQPGQLPGERVYALEVEPL